MLQTSNSTFIAGCRQILFAHIETLFAHIASSHLSTFEYDSNDKIFIFLFMENFDAPHKFVSDSILFEKFSQNSNYKPKIRIFMTSEWLIPSGRAQNSAIQLKIKRPVVVWRIMGCSGDFVILVVFAVTNNNDCFLTLEGKPSILLLEFYGSISRMSNKMRQKKTNSSSIS